MHSQLFVVLIAIFASIAVWVVAGALRHRRGARFGSLLALGLMVGIVLVAAILFTGVSPSPPGDPSLFDSMDGPPSPVNAPAPTFTLVDQGGATVSLKSFRGHAVALTFLDPVCTSNCPLIAQDFRLAEQRLGSAATKVDFVAVEANPIYRSLAFVHAFDDQEHLAGVPHWFFLTGSVDQLREVWDAYGIPVVNVGAGAMIDHGETAFIIDGAGRERVVLDDDPGSGTADENASFASVLVQSIDTALGT